MKEIWRKFKDFPNYSVSNFGNLKYPSGKLLIRNSKKRYIELSLKNDTDTKNTNLHKIIADTFLKEKYHEKKQKFPNENLEVNHKDGNKHNNNVNNLEWVTHSENMIHAYKNRLIQNKNGGTKIIYIDENNNKIEYNSVNIAAKKLGVSKCIISSILKKKRKPGYYQKKSNKQDNICKRCGHKYSTNGNLKHHLFGVPNRTYKICSPIKSNISIEELKQEFIESKKKLYLNFKYKLEYDNEEWFCLDKIDHQLKKYSITKSGRVKNDKKNREFVRGQNDDYIRVDFTYNKKCIGWAVHRLLATYFLEEEYKLKIKEYPNEQLVVNHKDGNKKNNNIDNLEWCTQKENMIHASENNLLNLTSENRIRNIYKLELNGEILETITHNKDKNINSVCLNNNKYHYQGYGYCYIEDYKENKEINPLLLSIFPDIIHDCENLESSDFDKLRPYISKERHIWKKELNGKRLCKYVSITEAIEQNCSGINKAINNNTSANGYGWEYLNYKDILNPNREYELNPVLGLEKYNLDHTKKIDYDLVRKCIILNCFPIWKIYPKTGDRIKKYTSVTEAEKEEDLGRGTITDCITGDGVIRGNYIWERANFYIEENNNYRKIPLNSRVINKKHSEYEIVQYDKNNNLIKVYNNRREINEELNIDLSMSYKENNGYIFNYLTEEEYLKIRHILFDRKIKLKNTSFDDERYLKSLNINITNDIKKYIGNISIIDNKYQVKIKSQKLNLPKMRFRSNNDAIIMIQAQNIKNKLVKIEKIVLK
jgi:hypothetical protein